MVIFLIWLWIISLEGLFTGLSRKKREREKDDNGVIIEWKHKLLSNERKKRSSSGVVFIVLRLSRVKLAELNLRHFLLQSYVRCSSREVKNIFGQKDVHIPQKRETYKKKSQEFFQWFSLNSKIRQKNIFFTQRRKRRSRNFMLENCVSEQKTEPSEKHKT